MARIDQPHNERHMGRSSLSLCGSEKTIGASSSLTRRESKRGLAQRSDSLMTFHQATDVCALTVKSERKSSRQVCACRCVWMCMCTHG